MKTCFKVFSLINAGRATAEPKSSIIIMDTIFIHLLLSFMLLCPIAIAAAVSDTLGKGRNITDGETPVSADGTFTLGFFSPGASTKRYLGIWFSASSVAVCWVANGDRPVNDNSGVLVVRDTGSLVLLDGSGQVTWSSNSTSSSSSSKCKNMAWWCCVAVIIARAPEPKSSHLFWGLNK